MPAEVLEYLRLDPGSRTLGQLLQERQWAVCEIERLRARADRLASAAATDLAVAKAAEPRRSRLSQDAVYQATTMPPAPAASIGQLLRLSEVRKLIGLSRSTIYTKIERNEFPAGVRVSARARRWRLVDITAWQDGLCR